MSVHIFSCGPLETNSYLFVCPSTQKAALIDPAVGSFERITPLLSSGTVHLDKILLTHSHWDHIAEVDSFKKHYPAPIYVHQDDSPNLLKPGADQLPCWIDIAPVTPDHLIVENQQIPLGNLILQVIHTPGHSAGSVCFYCKTENLLFSGDTLFKGSIGNLSFPTSKPHLMRNSLKKLASLPKITTVFPGHGPITTINAEQKTCLG